MSVLSMLKRVAQLLVLLAACAAAEADQAAPPPDASLQPEEGDVDPSLPTFMVIDEDVERRDAEDPNCCKICYDDKADLRHVHFNENGEAVHPDDSQLCKECCKKMKKCPFCQEPLPEDLKPVVAKAIEKMKNPPGHKKPGVIILAEKHLGEAGVDLLLDGLEEEGLFGQVRELYIWDSDLSDASVTLLAGRAWPELDSLSLEHNPKITSIKPLVGNQQNFPKLEYLWIGGPGPVQDLIDAFDAKPNHGIFPKLNSIWVTGVEAPMQGALQEKLDAVLDTAQRNIKVGIF